MMKVLDDKYGLILPRTDTSSSALSLVDNSKMVVDQLEVLLLFNCRPLENQPVCNMNIDGDKLLIGESSEDYRRINEKNSSSFDQRLGSKVDAQGFSVVYHGPNPAIREGLWLELCHFSKTIRHPWVVIGDFNAYLQHSEKSGGVKPNHDLPLHGKGEILATHKKNLLKEYELISKEELYWFQNCRCEWNQFGDCNTRFYHTSTIVWRKRNKIETLLDQKG
ncbi:hypothetical protein CR513_12209, partial [Mucuna pruriens]